MALKALMVRKKIDDKKTRLEELRTKDKELQTRETELEQSIQEAETDEEKAIVEEAVEHFSEEKEKHESEKSSLEAEISSLENDLADEEARTSKPPEEPAVLNQRKDEMKMESRKKFFGMNMQERDMFLSREDVKGFLTRVREMGAQQRGVTGADLTIPVIVLDLIRENITEYSKLVSRVRLRTVSGESRQNIMGEMPEAVWTEACASLNELSFGFSQTEVDGYKVGGIIYICAATLEDSDLNLANEIITALGAAIGIALDKAILYGTGIKMPLGIVSQIGRASCRERV